MEEHRDLPERLEERKIEDLYRPTTPQPHLNTFSINLSCALKLLL